MKSDKTEKCSVIVLNYNGKQFLEECLESLRNQTYADCKVYVLDNASTDGSVQFLHEHFPEVAVIEAAENFGTAQGSNEGVKNTGGEYVVLMSNDIKADPQCIAYLMQTIEQDPSIGICSSKLVRYYPDPQTGKYLVDNAGGIIDRFAFAMPLRNNTMNDEAEKGVREVFFSYGGCFVIKREVFNKVGGFDDKFFTLSDDVDLSWRIWLAGYKVAVNPAAFIYHKVSATLGVIFPRKEKRFWSERNNLRAMLKNYELFTLLYILPLYGCILALEGLFYICLARGDLLAAIGKAVSWNMANLKDTLRLRKMIQSSRVVGDGVILKKMYWGSIKFKFFFDMIKIFVFKKRNV